MRTLLALGCVALAAAARDAGVPGARRALLQEVAPAPGPSSAPVRPCASHPFPLLSPSLTALRPPDAHGNTRARPPQRVAPPLELQPLDEASKAALTVTPAGGLALSLSYACLVLTPLDDDGADTLRTALGDPRCAVVKLAGGCVVVLGGREGASKKSASQSTH
jgi:hypothetical protein